MEPIQDKFEPLVGAIDDTFTAEAVKDSAGNVYDALTGDDAAAYMDAGKEFEAALALFAAQTQRVMGSASRFATAAREEAIKKGFLGVKVPEKEAEPQTDEDTCPECKAASEDNLPQEVRQNQEEARQEGSPKPVQKETEE